MTNFGFVLLYKVASKVALICDGCWKRLLTDLHQNQLPFATRRVYFY